MTELSEPAEVAGTTELCMVCKVDLPEESVAACDWYCEGCHRRYPHALLKAHIDPFDYALELKNGTTIRFNELTIQRNGDWITIKGEDITESTWPGVKTEWGGHTWGPLKFSFERGIEIRISEIVWITDAPNGS